LIASNNNAIVKYCDLLPVEKEEEYSSDNYEVDDTDGQQSGPA
jgi:hypothetical protein